ncbi:unnamed protein product, partial [Iphiclides podalirius]
MKVWCLRCSAPTLMASRPSSSLTPRAFSLTRCSVSLQSWKYLCSSRDAASICAVRLQLFRPCYWLIKLFLR